MKHLESSTTRLPKHRAVKKIGPARLGGTALVAAVAIFATTAPSTPAASGDSLVSDQLTPVGKSLSTSTWSRWWKKSTETPSPTPTPTPTPTATATPTPTATATPTPTATATPTASATPTPTATATPTPTATATPTGTSLPILRNATFDSLAVGQVTPSGWMSQLGGTYTSTAPYEDQSVVAEAGRGNILRVRLDANTIVSNPAGTNGSTLTVALPKTVYTKACIKYDVRFDGNFDWSYGGKLPGLSGVAPGVSPTAPSGGNYVGDNGWSGRMMWLTPKSYSWAGPTNMGVNYMYSPLMASQYGDNVRWNKSFVAGQWHNIQTCYTMNTPGVANGKLETWFDGVQILANNAYTFRNRSDVGVGHLMWSVFRGGSTMDWAGLRTNYIDFDNVVISGN